LAKPSQVGSRVASTTRREISDHAAKAVVRVLVWALQQMAARAPLASGKHAARALELVLAMALQLLHLVITRMTSRTSRTKRARPRRSDLEGMLSSLEKLGLIVAVALQRGPDPQAIARNAVLLVARWCQWDIIAASVVAQSASFTAISKKSRLIGSVQTAAKKRKAATTRVEPQLLGLLSPPPRRQHPMQVAEVQREETPWEAPIPRR